MSAVCPQCMGAELEDHCDDCGECLSLDLCYCEDGPMLYDPEVES